MAGQQAGPRRGRLYSHAKVVDTCLRASDRSFASREGMMWSVCVSVLRGAGIERGQGRGCSMSPWVWAT